MMDQEARREGSCVSHQLVEVSARPSSCASRLQRMPLRQGHPVTGSSRGNRKQAPLCAVHQAHFLTSVELGRHPLLNSVRNARNDRIPIWRPASARCVVKHRGVTDRDEQALGAQQPRGDQGPGLGAGLVDEPMTLGHEFSRRRGNVGDLELDACVRNGDLGRPFGGAKASVRRFRQRP